MPEIPRSLCRDLRAVCRKLVAGRGPHPPVELIAGRDGLTARCSTPAVTVIYRRPGRLRDARVLVPAEALADAEGRDDSLVAFAEAGRGRVAAAWEDRGVPAHREYPAPPRPNPAPIPPANLTPAGRELLDALDAASEVAAREPGTRFALGCVQLRGAAGEVVATDSKQLLVRSGFNFPWKDDVLVPRSGVFGILAGFRAGPVLVGRTAAHVWVAAGPWAVGLEVNRAGKFPATSVVIPPAGTPATVLALGPADAAGLAAALPRLPGKDDDARPVTVDLTGRTAAVRAKGERDTRAAEVPLPGSRVHGPAVAFACDRDHLARALELGFTTLAVVAPDRPAVFRDGGSSYAFMPLTAGHVVDREVAAERVNGTAAGRGRKPGAERAYAPTGPAAEPGENGRPVRREPPGPRFPPPPPASPPAGPRNPAPRPSRPGAGAKARKPDPGLVEEAAAVRDTVRGLLDRLRGLLGLARRQRDESRVVRSTLKKLKKLDRPGR